MLLKTETALIEAILFLEPEPVHINALAKIAGISRDAVKQVLGQLEELYTDEARGLELMRLGDSYQLSPKTRFMESPERQIRKAEQQTAFQSRHGNFEHYRVQPTDNPGRNRIDPGRFIGFDDPHLKRERPDNRGGQKRCPRKAHPVRYDPDLPSDIRPFNHRRTSPTR
jgi:hypothetical protein